MTKWRFTISTVSLHAFPERFRTALGVRTQTRPLSLNQNDDEGWVIGGIHEGRRFRIICRNQISNGLADNVLWCDGVERMLFGLIERACTPPRELIDIIPRILNEDLKVNDLRLVEPE